MGRSRIVTKIQAMLGEVVYPMEARTLARSLARSFKLKYACGGLCAEKVRLATVKEPFGVLSPWWKSSTISIRLKANSCCRVDPVLRAIICLKDRCYELVTAHSRG